VRRSLSRDDRCESRARAAACSRKGLPPTDPSRRLRPHWRAGEEYKREYNSEDGQLARIHVRVWDERAYMVLKTAMRDNDPEVRHYATEALKYLESYNFQSS
jgi:hypothetical protein